MADNSFQNKAFWWGRICRADGHFRRENAINLGAEVGHDHNEVARGFDHEPVARFNEHGKYIGDKKPRKAAPILMAVR